MKEERNPESAILEYAHREKVDFICISTQGEELAAKISHSNTSNVIRKSLVPVLAVPHTYRARSIKKILYASDLENFDLEMTTVSAFAQALEMKMDMAHFSFADNMKLARIALDAGILARKYPPLERIYLEPFEVNNGFATQFDQLGKKVKPSLVAFFTHTNLTWFDKLFSTSRSETFSFITKTPMLVYRKTVVE